MPNVAVARQIAGPGVPGLEDQELEYEFEVDDEGLKELTGSPNALLERIGIPKELTVGISIKVNPEENYEDVGEMGNMARRSHGAASADDHREWGVRRYTCRARRGSVVYHRSRRDR